MSLEKAREFLLRVGTDEEFKQHLETARDWRSFARGANYDFTLEEFETVTNEIIEIEELRGEILEAIAGGQATAHPLYGLVINRPPLTTEEYEKNNSAENPQKGKPWRTNWQIPIPKQKWWGGKS